MYEITRDEGQQNGKENYKKDSMAQYERQLEELRKEKQDYVQKIDLLQHSIRVLEEKKSEFCYSTGGHTWVHDREYGLYGETFTYCEMCKKEG